MKVNSSTYTVYPDFISLMHSHARL
jgi:hypothetical protein